MTRTCPSPYNHGRRGLPLHILRNETSGRARFKRRQTLRQPSDKSVRDVAAGLVLAMRHGQCGHRYILSGEAIPLSRLLSRLRAISGRKAVPVPVPAMIAQTTALAMEFVANHVTHRAPAAIRTRSTVATMRSKSLFGTFKFGVATVAGFRRGSDRAAVANAPHGRRSLV